MGKGRDKRKKKLKQQQRADQKVLMRGPRPCIIMVDEQADISKDQLNQLDQMVLPGRLVQEQQKEGS